MATPFEDVVPAKKRTHIARLDMVPYVRQREEKTVSSHRTVTMM